MKPYALVHDTIRRVGTSLLTIVLLLPAIGQSRVPTIDSELYYEIGGADALRLPANSLAPTTQIPANAALGVNFTCGNFDALASISAALDRVVNILQSFDSVIANAIAFLPMYLLQRYNPGLYDLLQNALLRAEEQFNLSLKNCEQMERELARGESPLEEWIVLARGTEWKTVIGSGGVDVVTAKETVNENLGKNGVYWLCGERAGGEGQEPLRVVGDVTRAGWNILMNRSSCGDGGTGTAGGSDGEPPRLTQLFPSPEEAVEWTTTVVGDLVVRTDGTPDATRPGAGLLPDYNNARLEITEALTRLVEGADPPTQENLLLVSAPGTILSRALIEAIQQRDASEQNLLIGKLAGQAALERTVERALTARRLLRTGMRDPHVAATPAPRQLQSFIDDLEREIDNLLFESQVRREMTSYTAATLLAHEAKRRAQSRGLGTALEDGNVFDEGAVQPQEMP